MPHSKLKEIYEPEFTLKSFYTGGEVKWTSDGKTFLCHCGGSVQFLDVETGKVNGFIGDEEIPSEDIDVDIILTFELSCNDEKIISAHKSGLFKLWSFEDKSMLKHWRSVHRGPVSKLAITNDGMILATGGSDSSVRLWDLQYNACTKNLTGIKGVCSVLKFLEGKTSLLFGAGDDMIIKAWDIATGDVKLSLEGHYSTITNIAFSNSLNEIVSCSRDKVIILWSMKAGIQLNVIPTYESLESIVGLPDSIVLPGADVKHQGGIYIATGGDRGVIRVWDVLNAKEIYVQNNSLVRKNEDGGLAIRHLLYCKALSSFALVSHDHNIFMHSFDTFACTNQFVGYSDEILDLVYVGEDETHIAVATNSPDIKLYELSSMSCTLLTGHTGFVVTLTVAPQKPSIFASASKDKSIRVWALTGKAGASCIASGMFHNDSASGLAFSQVSLSFLLSGAEDNVLKLWKIPKNFEEEHDGSSLMMKASCLAHEKDINAIAVAPNDKIIITASLDKTAKLWNAKDLSPLGTLRGHRRGIWSAIFSPVDQVVMTCSADTTIKIWSVADLSCLKTLEGHESSVMKATFLSKGLQVISASGDGLMKLWTIKTSECIASFDGHTGKIWALAVSKDESHMVTGCSASKIVFWKDVTEEKQLEEIRKRQEKALKEQELFNLMESENFLSALKLALTLDRPATVLNIIKSVMKRGANGLSDTILQLDQDEKQTILKCASHWNMNSKTSYAAQFLVSALLDEISCGKLKPPTSLVESIIPYTEKHFNRLTQLMQDLYLLEYTKAIMKPAIK